MTSTPGAGQPQSPQDQSATSREASAAAPEENAAASKSTAASQEVTATAVVDFLRQYPQFFQEHSDLLLELTIPHESGRAVSLLERQVAVYRERQYAMDEQFNDIISNAKVNDALFEKTRLVILELLHCRTLAALNAAIAERIRNDFDASAASLVFVSERQSEAEVATIAPTAVRTALGEFYEKQRTWCGQLNAVQQGLLFPEHTLPIVSAAITPLHLPEDSALRQAYGLPLLLIGSVESGHFNSSLDTLFLDFIGEVLSVHLQHIVTP